MSSSVAFTRHGSANARPVFRPRFGPLAFSFLCTLIWSALNVRRISPLDLLPFAWTWLTLWLALSIGLELWAKLKARGV